MPKLCTIVQLNSSSTLCILLLPTLDFAGRVGAATLSHAWIHAAILGGGENGRLPVPRPLPESALVELEQQGFAVVAGWLPQASTQLLLDEALALEEAGARDAGVGTASVTRRVDQAVRKARSVWLHPPVSLAAGQPLLRLALSHAVERLRSTLAIGLDTPLDAYATELSFLYYPVGGRYERHLDVRRGAAAAPGQREVSLLLYLDEGWQEQWGGTLRIHGGDGATTDVAPEAGTLVLMRSACTEHEVLETARPRHCLVGWYRSPRHVWM